MGILNPLSPLGMFSSKSLPDNLREVEYHEGTGTQYYKLPAVLVDANTPIKIQTSTVETVWARTIFECRTSSLESHVTRIAFNAYHKMFTACKNSQIEYNTPKMKMVLGDKYTIELKASNIITNGIEYSYLYHPSEMSQLVSCNLFNNIDLNAKYIGRVYTGFCIKDEWKTCVNVDTGKACIFNTATGHIEYNAGSDDFIMGPMI